MTKFVLIISMLLITNVKAGDLKPFKSDGCSSFPDGTLSQKKLWLSCCQTHDMAYWQGGTYAQRAEADIKLKDCVTAVGEPTIAKIMLAGVRVGGTPFLPTKFRWGYGWPYLRPYRELSSDELIEIESSKKSQSND